MSPTRVTEADVFTRIIVKATIKTKPLIAMQVFWAFVLPIFFLSANVKAEIWSCHLEAANGERLEHIFTRQSELKFIHEYQWRHGPATSQVTRRSETLEIIFEQALKDIRLSGGINPQYVSLISHFNNKPHAYVTNHIAPDFTSTQVGPCTVLCSGPESSDHPTDCTETR